MAKAVFRLDPPPSFFSSKSWGWLRVVAGGRPTLNGSTYDKPTAVEPTPGTAPVRAEREAELQDAGW